MMQLTIAAMQPDDWPALRQIYAEGIATGNATFETEVPDWQKWDAGHRRDCRLVARDADSTSLLGWAALSAVSARHVYAGVAEVSIYVSSKARGYGVGKALLSILIKESELVAMWTLQAGIFLENTASLALHKSFGFREVGIRQRIGKLGDNWRDVVLLERRSSKAGML